MRARGTARTPPEGGLPSLICGTGSCPVTLKVTPSAAPRTLGKRPVLPRERHLPGPQLPLQVPFVKDGFRGSRDTEHTGREGPLNPGLEAVGSQPHPLRASPLPAHCPAPPAPPPPGPCRARRRRGRCSEEGPPRAPRPELLEGSQRGRPTSCPGDERLFHRCPSACRSAGARAGCGERLSGGRGLGGGRTRWRAVGRSRHELRVDAAWGPLELAGQQPPTLS